MVIAVGIIAMSANFMLPATDVATKSTFLSHTGAEKAIVPELGWVSFEYEASRRVPFTDLFICEGDIVTGVFARTNYIETAKASAWIALGVAFLAMLMPGKGRHTHTPLSMDGSASATA